MFRIWSFIDEVDENGEIKTVEDSELVAEFETFDEAQNFVEEIREES